MREIIRLAHLIEYIADDDVPKQDKVVAIKLAHKDGVITEDEALELAIEYA